MTASGPFVRRHPVWIFWAAILVLGGAGFFWWRAKAHKPRYVTATVSRGTTA